MNPTSNRFVITHRTRYQYSDPVAMCQNQIMMIPRDLPRVRCHDSALNIMPKPTLSHSHTDYYGNLIHTFSIESAHRELSVVATSDVEVTATSFPPADKTTAWERVRDAIASGTDSHWFHASEFRFPSPLVSIAPSFACYAIESFAEQRPILEAALDLTKRLHRDFKYDTTATRVDTPADRAFGLRAGVCQDFAHIQIACLRSIGLPARYVSGYLRTLPPPGKQRLVGADNSHAWLSLYAGEKLGWIDFDPTNACLVATDHIPICVGRDYRDVAPMRGVVLGGGSTDLRVSVDVEPITVDE
ncbi:MAG: transglutaminase family protein [Planctomycetaceae bacterium]